MLSIYFGGISGVYGGGLPPPKKCTHIEPMIRAFMASYSESVINPCVFKLFASTSLSASVSPIPEELLANSSGLSENAGGPEG